MSVVTPFEAQEVLQNIMKPKDEKHFLRLIDQVLQDPILLMKLSDRIYTRMQQDASNSWNRDRTYPTL